MTDQLDDSALPPIDELVARARDLTLEPASRILPAAHGLRVAHLLEQMASAEASGNHELVLLGCRPIIETSAFGLYYATHPDEVGRAIKGHQIDLASLSKFFESASLPEELDGVNGPGPLTWDQAWHSYISVSGSSIEVEYLKQWYKGISSVGLHGGFGAVQNYVSELDGLPVPNPKPAPMIEAQGCLDLCTSLLGLLIEAVEGIHNE